MKEGLVVKIGGSLIDDAESVVKEIKDSGVSVLIVPGGGIFADFVRREDKNDDDSHFDAISAMDRYGRFLSTFGLPVVQMPIIPKYCSAVFLPHKYFMKYDPLPHSWDVTSDSIAAWTASELCASLILVKSVDAEFSKDLKDTDIVDPYIFTIAEKSEIDVKIVNGRRADELKMALQEYIKATRL